MRRREKPAAAAPNERRRAADLTVEEFALVIREAVRLGTIDAMQQLAPLHEPNVLDIEGAAKLLKSSTKTVRRLLKSGKLRGRQLTGRGSHWRFYRSDIMDFIQGKS